jgi:hypothetical protein
MSGICIVYLSLMLGVAIGFAVTFANTPKKEDN